MAELRLLFEYSDEIHRITEELRIQLPGLPPEQRLAALKTKLAGLPPELEGPLLDLYRRGVLSGGGVGGGQGGGEKALELWREKLDFYLEEEAKAADPDDRFLLKKRIQEARARIRELESAAGA